MRRALCLAPLLMLAAAGTANAQGAARTPEEAIDRFHRTLETYNTAGALSLLGRDLTVFEFGVVDPTLEAYAFQHMPYDMDTASQTVWEAVSRQVGGSEDEPWVLTNYHVTGVRPDQLTPIDQITSETVILRRTGDAYRIIHFHWSTNDLLFQAEAQGKRTGQLPVVQPP